MINIPALSSSIIKHGILMKLSVNANTYYIANTYNPITYDGNTYTGLGHFLGMNEIQDDLKITNNGLQISFSGIPKETGDGGLGNYSSYVSLILDQKIKGSRVEIYRAFFDVDNNSVLTNSVSLRFSGYVSNYTITDGVEQNDKFESYTCVLQCSSIHAILEKKITGRRTNPTDQKALYPTDTGMDRVITISNTSFDFGKPYATPAAAAPAPQEQIDYGGISP